MNTLRDWLSAAAQQLTLISAQPDQEALWLTEHVLRKSSAQLYLIIDEPIKAEVKVTLDDLLEQRKNGAPLAYLLGTVSFAGLTLYVQTPTLIPRPETEEWVNWLIQKLQPQTAQKLSILDLCTGSGCIGVSLASALPEAKIVAVDIANEAVELARKNVVANDLKNVEVRQGNLFDVVQGEQFDLIVSNPPYLSEAEWQELDPSVAAWEDVRALTDNQDGYAFYRIFAARAQNYLTKESQLPATLPQLVCEIGYAQGPTVQKIFQDAGWNSVQIHQDLSGKDRWVTARCNH